MTNRTISNRVMTRITAKAPTELEAFMKVIRSFRKGRKVTGEQLREAAIATGQFNNASSGFWGGAVSAAASRGLLSDTNLRVVCKDPVSRGRKTTVWLRA